MSKNYNNDYIFSKFSNWYNFAEKKYKSHKINNYNACTLATINNDVPDARIVLLKEFSKEGFIFYTNSNSSKGQQINKNNNVALVFYWPIIKRQVRIVGSAELVVNNIADSYFKTRPYLSKIGAWASLQSKIMSNTLDIYKSIYKYTASYPHHVPRPPHWNGYLIKPVQIEFWRDGASRLHLRESFSLNGTTWLKNILYP